MKRFVHLLIAGSLLACQSFIVLPASPVMADGVGKGSDAQHAGKQDVSDSSQGYTFVTAKGQSLSLLVRRALQLYDQKNENITLTKAAAMFAETNIVKQLGSRFLLTGEQVTIDQALIEDYVQKSQNLSPQRLAAWQRYAERANFDLDHIQPVQTSSTRTDESSSGDTDDKNQGKTNQNNPANNKDGTKSEGTAGTHKQKQRQSLPALWWFAGLVALGTIYYLLGRQNNRK